MGSPGDSSSGLPNPLCWKVGTVIKPLDVARSLAAQGWVVLPCKFREKAPLVAWKDYQERRPTDEELERWFGSVALCNFWILCGSVSGLVVLDCDSKDALEWAVERIGAEVLEATPCVRTTKGWHFYFRLAPGERVPQWSYHKDSVDLDVRSDGGGVVCPPSVHKSGAAYRWVRSPEEHDLQPVPAALRHPIEAPAATTSGAPAPARSTLAELLSSPASEGGRNEWLTKVAGHFAKQSPFQDGFEAAVQMANRSLSPPLGADEVAKVCASIWQAEAAKGALSASADPDRYTDTGNAKRFAAMYAGVVYFVEGWGWRVYAPYWGTFVADRCALAELVRTAVAGIYEEAAACAEPKEAARIRKWADYSHGESGIRRLLAVAETLPALSARPEDFDADPELFCCANGVLDLRTIELLPFSPELKLTKRSPVEFDSRATSAMWRSHLELIMAGDRLMIEFLQRWAGRALTGISSSDNCRILMPYGVGANGKTITVETLSAVLGDYAVSADFTTFCVGKDGGGNAPRPDLARLAGARLVTATESGYHHRLDEALLKQYTGGELVSPRNLFSNASVVYRPQFSLLLSTNHEPRIEGADNGFWRRFLKVPFEVKIPEPDQDKHLGDKLRATELSGVLSWMLEGLLAWRLQDLDPPVGVLMATAEYRQSIDYVGQFMQEWLVPAEGSSALMSDVYKAYSAWCERGGIRARLTSNHLSARLGEHGVERGKHARTRQALIKGYWLYDAAKDAPADASSDPSHKRGRSFADAIAAASEDDRCEG